MTSLLQEKLCEVHTQAPPPSKDFHHLTVTKNEVIWKSWNISFRPNQEKIFPREVKKLHKDFILDEQLHKLAVCSGCVLMNSARPHGTVTMEKSIHHSKYLKCTQQSSCLSEQMQSIFGKPMLVYVLNLCQEHYDFLIRMPESLIIHILSFLNTEDIRELSKTCKRFWKLCNTEEFWESMQRLGDKYTLDVQTAKLPVYKKPIKVNQRAGYLAPMQRRQTTFF